MEWLLKTYRLINLRIWMMGRHHLFYILNLLGVLFIAGCAPDPHYSWQLVPVAELAQHPLLQRLKDETKLEATHRIDFRQLRVFRYALPFFQELLLVEQSSLLILDEFGNAHTNIYFPTTFRPISSLYFAGGGVVVQLLTGEIQLPAPNSKK